MVCEPVYVVAEETASERIHLDTRLSIDRLKDPE